MHLAARLESLQAADLHRQLRQAAGIDFASNDYLGLARAQALGNVVAQAVQHHGVGTAASRLLRGHHPAHAEAEASLAQWCGQPAALLFSSGWAANVGLVTALVGRDDTVICDALLHASLIDAARLSGAERKIVPHGDLAALRDALSGPRRGRCLVLTESLWSMDGDLTDLTAVVELAELYGASVVVDEAHATGLYGAAHGPHAFAGRVAALGLQQRVLATVHTGGKALGQAGAWVAGDQRLIDWLVNRARSFVFSTAVPPAVGLGLVAARDLLARSPERVTYLHAQADQLRARLTAAGLDVRGAGSPIVPVVLGNNARTLAIAAALQADGLDVRAVRPPTVPDGTARLRICVHADHTGTQLDHLADRLLHHLTAVRTS